MSKQAWQVMDYDVWGNEEDGWDVNNIFAGPIVYLLPKTTQSKKATIQALRRQKVLLPRVRANISDWDDQSMFFEDAENGRPAFELRRQEHKDPKHTRTARRR